MRLLQTRVVPIPTPVLEMLQILRINEGICTGEYLSLGTDPIPHILEMGPRDFPFSSVSSAQHYTPEINLSSLL